MANNRWKIVLGLSVLILMLVAAGFALGVYVGEHGLLPDTKSVLAGKNAQQGLPGGNLPQGNPGQGFVPQNQMPAWQPIPGLPAQPPVIVGRLQRIRPASLVINTQSGTREILLGDDVKFVLQSGDEISIEDLQKGELVGIYGASQMIDGVQFTADFVVKLEPKN